MASILSAISIEAVKKWCLACPITTTLALGGVVLVTIYLSGLRRNRKLPPGPLGWPIIGVAYDVYKAGQLNKFVAPLRQRYGDIFCYKYGNRIVCVLSNYELVHEAFFKDEFSGRPTFLAAIYATSLGGNGCVQSSGKKWEKTRKYVVAHLHKIGKGVGDTTHDQRVHMEVRKVLEIIGEQQAAPMDDTRKLFQCYATNITCTIAFGKRYNYDDEQFVGILEKVKKTFQLPMFQTLENFLPWIRYMPFFRDSTVQTLYRNNAEYFKLMREITVEHERDFDLNNIRDFIDLFIQTRAKYNNGEDRDLFEETHFYKFIFEMFLGGTDTPALILNWGMLYMLHNKDIQEKVHDEIEEIIGCERLPDYHKDGPMLPFTMAVVYEMMRMSCVVPMGVPHATTAEATVGGYVLPKNSVVFANLRAIQYSPRYWATPNSFNPQHFLDENGKFKPSKYMVTFSIGKRYCPGDFLSIEQIFCLFGAIMQRFRLTSPPDENLPPFEGQMGVNMSTPPFKICFHPRF